MRVVSSKFVLANVDVRLLEEVESSVVQRIVQVENNFDNSAVDDHFRAHQTWGEGCVECSIPDAGPMVSSLGDGVLFGMGAKALVEPSAAACQTVATRASSFVTILGSAGSPVVSRGDDPFVSYDDRTDFALDTVAPHGSHLGNLHEILIPAWALSSVQFAQDYLIQFFLSLLF